MRRLLATGVLSLALAAGSVPAPSTAVGAEDDGGGSATVDPSPRGAVGSDSVRAKPKKPTKKSPDGHYVGSESPEQDPDFDDIVFNFDVRGKGRRITDFTFAMNVVCSGYPLYTEYVVQPMNDMRVNPRSGRFADVVTGTTDSGTEYRVTVSGRLRGTQVRAGTMSYDVGICQRGTDDTGPAGWVAARTSKRFG